MIIYDHISLEKDINKISYLSSGLREGSVENEDFHFKHLYMISFFNQVNALHIFKNWLFLSTLNMKNFNSALTFCFRRICAINLK